MTIRTYLTLSYMGIVLLVTLGTLTLAEWLVRTLAEKNVLSAEDAVRSVTEANLKLSEDLLTMYGMKIVEMKAYEVADRLSHRLGGLPSYDYERLRRDERLRRLATQDIPAYKRGKAGYVDVYDRTGLSVWHPNRSVEGRNFADWKNEFPEMWKYVERSFTEEKVAGYYDFFDEDSRRRKKYMVLVHSPGTPFIVVATVNIGEFFEPVHDEIIGRSDQAVMMARQSVEESGRTTQGKLRLLSMLGILLLLGIGAVLALWFAGSVSRPIMRLRDAVADMGEGNWNVAVPEQGAVEVRHLGRSFNELGKQLADYIEKRDFIRDTFGRYLTREVATRLLESRDALELGGKACEITMIMSDIRGFTALIADMPPHQVIVFLNRYLGKMVEVIQNHRGVVDEIMGDGIFAFFGAPEPLDDHPSRAVAGALKMQSVMDEINLVNQADGFRPIEMGIAVHTGTVVVGNIGSEKRTKYGVVGCDVNLTARMESYAVGGQVLTSQSTYERISGLLEVADVLEIHMKGVDKALVLYDVVGIGEPYDIHLQVEEEEMIPVRNNLEVCLYKLDRKAVAEMPAMASITHFSSKHVTVLSAGPLSRWDDVKIQIPEDNYAHRVEPSYAKVISVKDVAGRFECLMRFTSIPPGALEALQKAASA
ncbi:MAG: adenylate/guanylate cyclase domain-containing protein [Pseudomonadota bacterium]